MIKLILASTSPFRAALLKRAGCFDFEVRAPKIDETVVTGRQLPPSEVARSLAAQKALSVWEHNNDGEIILGADTIVRVDNEIFGQPKDEEDARRMLRRLSGVQHEVYTGIHICGDYIETSFSDKTIVTMYEMSEREIDEYLKYNEFWTRPGAYDISRMGSMLVERINGDYNNILGLPVGLLIRQLRACGFRI